MKVFISAVCLFLAPWLFGMLFDAVVYLRVPNPLDWDMFSRGFALIISTMAVVMLTPLIYVFHADLLGDDE